MGKLTILLPDPETGKMVHCDITHVENPDEICPNCGQAMPQDDNTQEDE